MKALHPPTLDGRALAHHGDAPVFSVPVVRADRVRLESLRLAVDAGKAREASSAVHVLKSTAGGAP